MKSFSATQWFLCTSLVEVQSTRRKYFYVIQRHEQSSATVRKIFWLRVHIKCKKNYVVSIHWDFVRNIDYYIRFIFFCCTYSMYIIYILYVNYIKNYRGRHAIHIAIFLFLKFLMRIKRFKKKILNIFSTKCIHLKYHAYRKQILILLPYINI